MGTFKIFYNERGIIIILSSAINIYKIRKEPNKFLRHIFKSTGCNLQLSYMLPSITQSVQGFGATLYLINRYVEYHICSKYQTDSPELTIQI